MQITVKSTTKESKQAQGKTYWGVKHEDGNWYNLITNDKPAMGARFDVEVKETQYNGRTYRWATPHQGSQQASGGGGGNGHIPWEDYEQMMRAAHGVAWALEPDAGEHADRSTARAAIVNTVMIAFSNGKLALPKDDMPPDGADIPF